MSPKTPLLGDDGELHVQSSNLTLGNKPILSTPVDFGSKLIPKIKILLFLCLTIALWGIFIQIIPFFRGETLSLLVVSCYIAWLFYTPWSTKFAGNGSKQHKAKRNTEISTPNIIERKTVLSQQAFFIEPAHQAYLRGERIPLKVYRENDELPLLEGIAVGIFLLILGVVVPYFLSLQIITITQLVRIGIPTQGIITGCHIVKNKETQYILTYQYTAEDYQGQIFQGKFERTQEICESTTPGTPISVEYLPYDPSISSPEISYGNLAIDFILSIFTSILGLAGAGFIKKTVSTYRWASILQKRGVLLSGTVISCTGKMKYRIGFVIEVEYVFVTPEGQEVFGNVSHLRNALSERPLPTNNTPLAILYVDRNCYKVL